MAFLLICAFVFYILGGRFGLSRIIRSAVLAILYIVVLLIHLVLPDGHHFRNLTGDSFLPWAIFGNFVILILIYRFGLSFLWKQAKKKSKTKDLSSSCGLSSAELERYARHIVLREIGGPGQMAIRNAKVLVIGAGGLGAPALQYLAASGVGTIGVIDDDIVENANLQRQIIHQDRAIGTPKVFSAKTAMLRQNPFINVKAYNRRLTKDIAESLFAEFEYILEGSDNFETRYLTNKATHKLGLPLISGALSQWEGQISIFDSTTEGPCYQCVFPQTPAQGLAPSCAEVGVFSPLPGIIGSIMASETLKIITGAGNVLRHEMLIYDALYGQTRTIKLVKREDCSVCCKKI